MPEIERKTQKRIYEMAYLRVSDLNPKGDQGGQV
jgi:hypothetical protein